MRISKNDLRFTAKVMIFGAIAIEIILDVVALVAIINEKLRGNSLRDSMLHVCSAYVEFWREVFIKVSGYFNRILIRLSSVR